MLNNVFEVSYLEIVIVIVKSLDVSDLSWLEEFCLWTLIYHFWVFLKCMEGHHHMQINAFQMILRIAYQVMIKSSIQCSMIYFSSFKHKYLKLITFDISSFFACNKLYIYHFTTDFEQESPNKSEN